MMEVRMFIDGNAIVDGIPLHEYLIRYLMHHGVSGATVFAGIMGYGSHHRLHEPQRIAASDPVPILLIAVDHEEKLKPLLGHCRKVMSGGLIVTQRVEAA